MRQIRLGLLVKKNTIWASTHAGKEKKVGVGLPPIKLDFVQMKSMKGTQNHIEYYLEFGK